MINTDQHHIWTDSDDYFAYGCGATGELAKWFVEKKVKMVGYGCQANDHPMATKLVDHGLGPTHPHLIDEWKAEYGRDPKIDFPLWEPGHKYLMVEGGIPGIENVGDDGYGKEGGSLRRSYRQALLLRRFPLALCHGRRLRRACARPH